MGMVEWAKSELEMLVKDDDEMQREINRDILQIVETFAEQGHSGFSASYALSIIRRLLDWKPITPLTGDDDEWMSLFDDSVTEQNKRCSAVFRDNGDNATAHYINGKVFSDDGGKTWYTSRDSFVPVTFPFTVPEDPEYIIVEPEAVPQ